MKMRMIQLIKNYYVDEQESYEMSKNKALGEYCVFGYFDALVIHQLKDVDDSEKNNLWSAKSKTIVDESADFCSKRSLLLFTEDEKKDQNFWREAQKYAFLFVSMLRLKDSSGVDLKQYANNPHEIYYMSNSHSEIIVIRYSNDFLKGALEVLKLRDKFRIFKMHTIYSIREDVLESEETIEKNVTDQKIKCRFRMVVKDAEKTRNFMEELKKSLHKEEALFQITKYDTFGSGDMLIELNHISICKILKYYKSGELLTHMNETYRGAVFDIDSEFLFGEEGVYDGSGIKHSAEANRVEGAIQNV